MNRDFVGWMVAIAILFLAGSEAERRGLFKNLRRRLQGLMQEDDFTEVDNPYKYKEKTIVETTTDTTDIEAQTDGKILKAKATETEQALKTEVSFIPPEKKLVFSPTTEGNEPDPFGRRMPDGAVEGDTEGFVPTPSSERDAEAPSGVSAEEVPLNGVNIEAESAFS